MDEEKEYKLIIKQLKDENAELKLKCIDVTKYESWTAKEIVSWIVSLDNNRFDKYKDTLLINLEEEGIEGAHLCHINEIDLKGWGIKNFMDKKLLLQRIKELTSQNYFNENDKNEGVSTAYI